MSIQALTPPQDITWKRMAYSRDMVDTNFGDMAFPPKWRTSLTVYFYIVPEEETVDAYPEARIVYFKLSCSITGWNPTEELLTTKQEAYETDIPDDLQKSIWEAVEASGWASKYWACHGAIMQIGIFPGKTDDVGPDDYPYIMDFEPKKRELYESFSEGSEILSGSSDQTSLTKGNTSVNSTEIGAQASAQGPLYGASISYKNTSTETTVNQNTTDTSREARETLSRTTSGSQMYQLFNGYHLGTNRAVFVVSPRPHTKTGKFSLIDGERKLEGIQDVFLVVNMPRSLKGFCIQASIDTGHKSPNEHQSGGSMNRTFSIRKGEFGDPPCLDGDTGFDPPGPPGGGGAGGGGGTGDDDGTDPEVTGTSFIVTRRIIQSCGLFDENGTFIIQKITRQDPSGPKRPDRFVGESFLPTKSAAVRRSVRAKLSGTEGGVFDDCIDTTVMAYNHNLSRISKTMLEIFSAGAPELKSFKDTNTFKTLFAIEARHQKITLAELVKLKYLTQKEAEILKKFKVHGLQDIFKRSSENIADIDIFAIRKKIVATDKKS